jgi:hypothetical protein
MGTWTTTLQGEEWQNQSLVELCRKQQKMIKSLDLEVGGWSSIWAGLGNGCFCLWVLPVGSLSCWQWGEFGSTCINNLIQPLAWGLTGGSWMTECWEDAIRAIPLCPVSSPTPSLDSLRPSILHSRAAEREGMYKMEWSQKPGEQD